MSCRRAVFVFVVSLAASVVLGAAGSALPAPPLGGTDQLDAWWRSNGTSTATLAIVRLAGLALSVYLGLLAAMGVVVALTRWRWADTVFARVASEGARRLIVGGSVAAALSIPAVVSATASSTFDLIDLGPVAEFTVSDVGPSATDGWNPPRAGGFGPTLEIDERGARPEARPPDRLGDRADSDDHRQQTWIVAPGDHLWSIAAETVAERTGDSRESVIAEYWLRLIEHNRDVVGDNPDLIHPGQLIVLPR